VRYDERVIIDELSEDQIFRQARAVLTSFFVVYNDISCERKKEEIGRIRDYRD